MIKLNLMEAAMKSAGTAKMARVEPEQPTVLIVEPSSERRRVVRMALALAGYACHEAADTSAALLILRSCSPVAIVTGVKGANVFGSGAGSDEPKKEVSYSDIEIIG